MSIINKMHKDLDDAEQIQPILSGLPSKKITKKVLLLSAIAALAICSIVLTTMIFLSEQGRLEKESDTALIPLLSNASQETEATNVLSGDKTLLDNEKNNQKVIPQAKKTTMQSDNETLTADSGNTMQEANANSIGLKAEVETTDSDPEIIPPKANQAKSEGVALVKLEKETLIPKKEKVEKKVPKQQVESKTKKESVAPAIKLSEPVTFNSVEIETFAVEEDSFSTEDKLTPEELEGGGSLSIHSSDLSPLDLANIYLGQATKAQVAGDNDLAAEKWEKVLSVKPDYNQVRQSLAMYYYSQEDANKAVRLLENGVKESPDYADFSLMLSRIALKEGRPDKALFYLDQNPPQVEGNLDYYVSHAILAQKFKKYEHSEELYKSLLSQRPNNGRWLMSLGISQDRQGKKVDSISTYQKALQQNDLSTKAKDYIKKRLAFLSLD